MCTQHNLEIIKDFIVVDNNANYILAQDKKSLFSLYASVFAAPPWNETWTPEQVNDEWQNVRAKEGFRCVIQKINEEPAGFCWGYDVPSQKSGRVDFTTICNKLQDCGVDYAKTFYVAEVGVREEFRRQKIATSLLEKTLSLTDKQYLCYRTKNPAMTRVFEKAFGETYATFPEESAFSGGQVFVMQVRK